VNKSLQEAFELIESAPEELKWVGHPATEDMISGAEQDLGVKFPPELAAFMSRFGYGGVGGCAIYGVAAARSSESHRYPDIVSGNLRLRKYGVPESLIVFEDVGDGQVYALDLSVNPTEPPVVALVPAEAVEIEEFEFVADSFGEHLLSEIRAVSPIAGQSA
jgi:hypothetical protein